MKLYELLKENSERNPKEIAVIDGNRKINYQQLEGYVDKLSEALRSVGCGQSCKIAIVMDNSIEWIISFFSISKAGGIIIALPPVKNVSQLEESLVDTDADMVITNIKTERSDISVVNIRLQDENLSISINGYYKKNAEKTCDDVALMMPTSGSLGRPKIAMLSNEGLINNMYLYRMAMGYGSRQRAMVILPMSHIYCITAQILTHISRGDEIVINRGIFFIKDFYRCVEKHKITSVAFVPYMAVMMSNSKINEFDISSLRTVTLSAAKTSGDVFLQLRNKCPSINFVSMYGMTEAGSRIAMTEQWRKDWPVESVGKAIFGVEVRITRGGVVMPTGFEGQIEVKSKGVMKGYYKQDDLTKETIVDGWLRTGDMGRIDEDGYLYITGRVKNMIISGGENINPTEVEQCILKMDCVVDAAVFGAEDELLGEIPCAYYVSERDIRTAEMVRFCKANMSLYKVPRVFRRIRQIPRINGMKVDRTALKEMAGVV